MPLLGSAAMLLSFDVEADAIDEHDRWHTHEHLPERLSIPGFLRGTRSVASGEGARHMVVDEVESLATLAGDPALHRWLLDDALPAIPAIAGLGSARLLQGAQPAAMTNEQRIRLERRGARDASLTAYRAAHSLAATELAR